MPAQRTQRGKLSAKEHKPKKPYAQIRKKRTWKLPTHYPNGGRISYLVPNMEENVLRMNNGISDSEIVYNSVPPPLSRSPSSTLSDISTDSEKYTSFKSLQPKLSGAKPIMKVTPAQKQANQGDIEATEQQLLANDPPFQQPTMAHTSSTYHHGQFTNLQGGYQGQEHTVEDIDPAYDPSLTTMTSPQYPSPPSSNPNDEEAKAASRLSLQWGMDSLAKYVEYPESGVQPLGELLGQVAPRLVFANSDTRNLEAVDSNSQQVQDQFSPTETPNMAFAGYSSRNGDDWE